MVRLWLKWNRFYFAMITVLLSDWVFFFSVKKKSLLNCTLYTVDFINLNVWKIIPALYCCNLHRRSMCVYDVCLWQMVVLAPQQPFFWYHFCGYFRWQIRFQTLKEYAKQNERRNCFACSNMDWIICNQFIYFGLLFRHNFGFRLLFWIA